MSLLSFAYFSSLIRQCPVLKSMEEENEGRKIAAQHLV
jgi:hypothetical protein